MPLQYKRAPLVFLAAQALGAIHCNSQTPPNSAPPQILDMNIDDGNETIRSVALKPNQTFDLWSLCPDKGLYSIVAKQAKGSFVSGQCDKRNHYALSATWDAQALGATVQLTQGQSVVSEVENIKTLFLIDATPSLQADIPTLRIQVNRQKPSVLDLSQVGSTATTRQVRKGTLLKDILAHRNLDIEHIDHLVIHADNQYVIPKTWLTSSSYDLRVRRNNRNVFKLSISKDEKRVSRLHGVTKVEVIQSDNVQDD